MGKILIVDDEHLTVDMLSNFLQLIGYEAIGAYSGRQMWDKLAYEEPDAILLDIMLPDGDGIDLCRQLRAHDGTRTVPILMVSARNPPSREEAQAAGANDYFSKPVDLGRLRKRLQELGVH